MPYQLEETEEELVERLTEEANNFARLSLIEQELELYRHPAWQFMLKRLRDMEVTAFEAMINPEVPNLETLRERIRIARYLAGLEEDLIRERARLKGEEE